MLLRLKVFQYIIYCGGGGGGLQSSNCKLSLFFCGFFYGLSLSLKNHV